MPYGTSSKYFDAVIHVRNYYPGGYQEKTYNMSNTFKREGWLRSGTNSASVRNESRTGRKKFRLVSLRNRDKRLSITVVDPRTGKSYYKRVPMESIRLVTTRSKKEKKKKFFKTPNRLTYQSIRTVSFGPEEILGRYNNDWYRTISGPLWAPFLPFGSYVAMSPDPSSYLNENSWSSPVTNMITKLSTEGLSRFYEKVQNSAVSLAQALGERRQTAAMLSDAVTRLAGAVRSAKKGNLRSAFKQLVPQNSKSLANDWLLYQYGVKPLLSDIDGAAKHLAIGEKVEFNVTVKRTEKVPRTLIFSESRSDDIKCVTDIHTEADVTVIYKARLRCNEPLLRDLSRLGFTDPLALAWELLPYSFVADWFIPIGDYLANMDAFSNVELVYCTKTVFVKEHLVFERRFGGRDGNNYTWPYVTSGFTSSKVSCVREVLSVVPDLPVPSFKDPVSRDHLLNAVALLRQLRK